MATTRAYTFNSGTTISGTTQKGAIAVQTGTVNFQDGHNWISGPDESLGYVIAGTRKDFPRSAFDIRINDPNAKSGVYTVYPTGVEGVTEDVYCDMDTEGGPWTLLLTSKGVNGSWSTINVVDFNSTTPSIISDYSILKYGDDMKHNIDGKLNYRIDAEEFGRWGGVWEAPFSHTFTAYDTSQSLCTNIIKWDTWTIDTSLTTNSAISNRMPWIDNATQILSTWDAVGSWWGTLVTNSASYNPAPYISGTKPTPGILWYWVK